MKKTMVRFLLLACLMLALCLTMAACGEKEQPAVQAEQEIELYWSVEAKEYNSGTYTRTAQEDGTVMMILSKDGTQDRYPVKDYFLACKIDLLGVAGMVFDENGVIVEAKRVEECTGGFLARNAVVTSIDGSTVTCNTSGLLDGRDITFELDEATPIYDVAGVGITVGIPKAGLNVDDLVNVVLNEDGSVRCIYAEGYTEPMDIYWNVNRMYDSTAKVSTRMSDPTGGYTVTLACNGEVKDYRVKESNIVQEIDAMAAKCMGLEFDEEGYITRVIHGGTACGGGSVASWYDVMEIDGQRAEFKRIANGSNMGNTYSGMMAKNMKVFDVSGNGAFIGEPTELRVGDRVHCLLDSRKRLSVVFVVGRRADAPIFWNVDRMWDSKTSQTTRKANADGVYEILVAVGGEQKTVYTTDWEIANKIDGRAAMCFGLRLDDSDNIEKFYTPESVTAGTYASWYNITKLDGNNIELLKSTGDFKQGVIAADCEIYDCSPTAQYEGIKTTLQEGDLVHTLKNDKGEVSVAFVITRYVRWPVYYNLDRKWSDTNKCTTRTRESDGYFHFRMAVDGQEVMLKTKSYDVANAIDKEIAKCLTMSVDDDGIIYQALHAKNSTLAGGAARSSYTLVTAVGKNSFTTYKDTTDKTTVEKHAWNMKVYNVSTNVLSHQGEETTVQEGDSVHCLSNLRGEITFVYVYSRPLNLPVYYNLDRKWSDSTKASTRTPNSDGEYEFQMAYGGGEVTLKTTDPQVVYDIDKEVAKCVALRIDENGYITYATHAKNSTYCGGGIGMSYANVTEVNGNQVTVRKDGKLTTFTISDDCEMFVTGNIEGLSRGNYTTVRVGDYVHCLKNKNGQTNYMAIMSRVKQLPTVDHTCQHVTEDVTWYEWDGGAFPMEGHYVLTDDLSLDSRVTIDAGVEITLCLNGHTVTNTDRFFNVYGTLNLCDHKDADGKYQGTLESTYSGKVYGTLAYIYNNKSNATLNIYGGNYVHSGEAYIGGIVFIGQTPDRTYTATMNLYDGVLSGGTTTGKAGAVEICNGCAMNMYGGKITGSKASANGGAIDLSTGTFNMYGGEISGNTSTGNGGGVNVDKNGVFTMTGGIIEKNKGAEGGNVRVGEGGEATVSDAAIVRDGTASGGAGGNFTVIGKLTLKDGATVSGGMVKTQGTAISAFANAATAHAIVVLEGVNIKGTIRTDTGNGPVELFIKDTSVTGQVKVGVKNCTMTVEGKVDLPNVYLTDGKKISISENGLDTASTIAVSMVNYDLPFVTVTDDAQKAVFKPYKPATEKVVADGNDLYLQSAVAAHKHCACGGNLEVEEHKTCTDVTFAAWDSKTSLPTSGNYFLMEDVTISGPITVDSNLTLCLNGHTVTSKTRVFSIKGTLNLCDCADTQGTVIGNTDGTHANGGVFYVYNNSTFNLYGGTLTVAKKVTSSGGVGCVAGGTNGKMYMYGGTVENGQATKNGGNLVVWDGAKLFVYGGVIQNGSGAGGGNVDTDNGSLTITGGKLIGGNATGYGGNIRIGHNGTLTVTGGEILGGTAPSGGAAIYGNNKSGTGSALIKLLGGKITSGTSNTANNNCLLNYGQSVIVGGDVQIDKIAISDTVRLVESTEKPLTTAASVGVAASSAISVMESASATAASVIKSTCALAVSYEDGAVKLG